MNDFDSPWKVRQRRRILRFCGAGSCLLALAASAAGMSGCSAATLGVGALVDTALVTSPVWGPTIRHWSRMKKVDTELVLRTGTDARTDALTFSTTDLDPPPAVAIRLFEGLERKDEPKKNYYAGLAILPLVPFAGTEADLGSARGPSLPEGFQGPAAEPAPRSMRFPRSRLPEGLRRDNTIGLSGDAREAALDILGGELASLDPSKEDYRVSFCSSQKDRFLYQLTTLARETFAGVLGSESVRIQLPAFAGRYAIKEIRHAANKEEGEKKAKADSSDNEPGDETHDEKILFAVMDDACVAEVPATRYRVHASPGEYHEGAASQVVTSGRIRILQLEITNFSYGVTTIGGNLLSFIGLPLSRSGLVMELDVEATRSKATEPILSKTYSVKTDRRFVGLYYGGDIDEVLARDLEEKLKGIFTAFAQELQPLLDRGNL